jgi:hypothetical protein
MDDHPSDHGQHANRAPAKDLAALRRQRPDWHIRHASDDHPGELGYLATRGSVLLTAENLTRLGDRIADADRSWPAAPPPAILITGPPGWNSGPCLDPGGRLGQYMGRWAIDVQPAQVPVWCAVRQRGSETRVVIAFSAPELADKLTAIEDADGAAPDVGTAGVGDQ